MVVKGRWSGVGLGARVGGHVLVLFGGYDHYRPTMTHLRHGLLEERHAGLVTLTLDILTTRVVIRALLGEVLGRVTALLGRVDVRRVRGTK